MTTTGNVTARFSRTAIIACGIVALMASLLLASIAFAPQAYAANKQLNAPTTVSDDITRVSVNKLDADTHEYVQGASMAIIEKATGKVVDEWVTGSGAHMNAKGLDVDKVYILREISAPNGYSKVEDTEFKINATEGTGLTILSGAAELTESYKVNLYDKALPNEDVTVVTKERTPSTSTRIVAPKTGDETPIALVAAFVAAGIVLIFVLQIPKRRLRDEEF